jgi:hydroxymethylpyrimidine pyrophosphatase-like HAD family hydrolase
MIKPTPNIKKRITYYASMLPVSFTETGVEDSTWTGSDLMLTGIVDINGQPINPDGKYNVPVPVNHQVNHEERMNKAYKLSGKQGVFEYIQKYIREDQEFVNALRHEIFASGNFEVQSIHEQYTKNWLLINTGLSKIEGMSMLCKRVGDEHAEEISLMGDKIISKVSDTKMIKGINDQHLKELDMALNKVYKIKSKVLGINL